ncbi:MAG: transcription antiterminator [Erysipelotrichaceae bacterium]|nr:transcription antiterminator [Erysipelotrichaceae bacterium]
MGAIMKAIMDYRWQKIIEYLYNLKGETGIRDIAVHTGMSVYMVKSLIAQNKDDAESDGFELTDDFKIRVLDANTFNVFISRTDASDGNVIHIITTLINKDDYVKIDSLANELFLSRASTDRLIVKVKEKLKEYNLKLISKPRYGIKIEGNEHDKRRCYRKLDYGDNDNFDHDSMVYQVQKYTMEVLDKYRLGINNNNFYNLVQHIVIAIIRIRKGNCIDEEVEISRNDDIREVYEAADELCEKVEKAFGIRFNETEKNYIVIHLMGKRIFDDINVANKETIECVNDILREINDSKGVDLRHDGDLFTSLVIHIQPLISRLKYGIEQDNPILMEIKKEQKKGYELALCGCEVISKRYGFKVSEEEAGYLALHFTLAIEKQRRKTEKKKIVIVCTTGRGTSKLFEYHLMLQYDYKEDDIILSDMFHLKDLDFTNIKCILTTVPLSDEYPVPVIMADLSMKNWISEEEFYHREAKKEMVVFCFIKMYWYIRMLMQVTEKKSLNLSAAGLKKNTDMIFMKVL